MHSQNYLLPAMLYDGACKFQCQSALCRPEWMGQVLTYEAHKNANEGLR